MSCVQSGILHFISDDKVPELWVVEVEERERMRRFVCWGERQIRKGEGVEKQLT